MEKFILSNKTFKQKAAKEISKHLENSALKLAKPGVCSIMWGEVALPKEFKNLSSHNNINN